MTRERGRPRTFDIDEALDRAVDVFWKHGFQDASMHELTEAMGLSKPSLYAAFGDKEALYLKTLERYLQRLVERHAAALTEQADGRQAVHAFLRSLARMLVDPMLPGGCFIINGTADFGGSTIPASVEMALRTALGCSEAMILARLERAQRDGDMPAAAEPAALAALFGSLIAGLGVLAKSGASEAKLNTVIDTAMTVWPQAPRANTKRQLSAA
ncbi:TetR/AcrR family transcriptional regulator [Massilia sp. CF038]|uniref:TetR/AcrR family transcriptional regulator n=1 Tax=Massilia sp. CF038 TaxID=1881045 RepID=UPI000921DF4A|nr:TetR/AcrR family transcriptional regulator [Massilia sp. CF038]SHH23572.1 transcriptional regulator, TetR family [Massilia sp. CF038]